VPLGRAWAYAGGDLGLSIAYFAVGFFFLFYLTDLVGLPPAVAGTVILIGKIWDGVNDPLIGVLVDRTRSRRGRKRSFLLFGAAPFGLSFAVLWWIPSNLSVLTAAVIVAILFLAFATTYSLVGVPYQALVPTITLDYDERTRLVGLKAILSAVGAVLGGVIALAVSAQTDVQTALRLLALAFGLAITSTTLLAARSVRPYIAQDTVDIEPVPLARYVAILTERSVAVLMAYKVVSAVATGVLTAALPFFALHVVGSTSTATFALAAYTIAGAASVPLWSRLTHRRDKRRLMLVSSVAASAVLLTVGLVVSAGSTATFILGSGILGIAMSAYLVIPPSFVPDLVEWYQWRRGERHESIFFGLWMSTHQLGVGLAAFILGLCLSASGYVSGANIQSPTALLGVRLAFALVPAVFMIAAAILLQAYAVTRSLMHEAISGMGSSSDAGAS
jgi:GPH family glycoside/pentoside/hexuronide:cation symporter